MTAAAVIDTLAHDHKLARFIELRAWMEPLGICTSCGVGMALERVEQEGGEAFTSTVACTRTLHGLSVCRDRMEAAIGTMPPPQRPHPKVSPKRPVVRFVNGKRKP